MTEETKEKRTILIPAYLEVCKHCGEHGRIVTTKSFSPEFASKEGGEETLKIGIRLGLISKEESLHIRHQINESDLPPCDEHASPYGLVVADVTTLGRIGDLESKAMDELGLDQDEAEELFQSKHLPAGQKWLM